MTITITTFERSPDGGTGARTPDLMSNPVPYPGGTD
jgi:hypothetical protein